MYSLKTVLKCVIKFGYYKLGYSKNTILEQNFVTSAIVKPYQS